MRLDDWSKERLRKREHVHSRWERGTFAVIEAGVRLFESDAETGRTLSHALQRRQRREHRSPRNLVRVKDQYSTVARENPDELPNIRERIAARDVLENARGVNACKTPICKDGEVSPFVQRKRQTIGARIEAACKLQHLWRDVHPCTAGKYFRKGLADTTEPAPKVESLAVAVDPETARLDVADGCLNIPLTGLPEACQLFVGTALRTELGADRPKGIGLRHVFPVTRGFFQRCHKRCSPVGEGRAPTARCGSIVAGDRRTELPREVLVVSSWS